MVTAESVLPNGHSDEARLNAFGLSTELIHAAYRPGLSRALNRTSLALPSSPGTDIYHDTMENLSLLLSDRGWKLAWIDRQPRLVHPESLIAITVASGTDVASSDRRRAPRARKGVATRAALAPPVAAIPLSIFEDQVESERTLAQTAAQTAPLWLLVHERTDHGLRVELSRPALMTESGVVYDWEDRILIDFLDLNGDLSIFDEPDDAGGFDVFVEPLT